MPPVRRRKNLFIDQCRIDRVKALLGVDTETEAIDRAVTMVEDLARFEACVGDSSSRLIAADATFR